MTRINNKDFLDQLSTILITNGGNSSIYFTQKRLTPSLNLEDTKGMHDLSSNITHSLHYPQNEKTYPILIRLSMNKNKSKDSNNKLGKTKLSTVVEVHNLDKFWTEYSQALKNGFTGLKKKDKKKKKKAQGKVAK